MCGFPGLHLLNAGGTLFPNPLIQSHSWDNQNLLWADVLGSGNPLSSNYLEEGSACPGDVFTERREYELAECGREGRTVAGKLGCFPYTFGSGKCGILDWQLEEISEYRILRQTYLTGTENVLSLLWGRER